MRTCLPSARLLIRPFVSLYARLLIRLLIRLFVSLDVRAVWAVYQIICQFICKAHSKNKKCLTNEDKCALMS